MPGKPYKLAAPSSSTSANFIRENTRPVLVAFDEKSVDVNAYFGERFQLFANSGHSAALLGSTYIKASGNNNELSAQATEISYVADDCGMRVGVIMASSTGKRRSKTSDKFIQATATRDACKLFTTLSMTHMKSANSRQLPTELLVKVSNQLKMKPVQGAPPSGSLKDADVSLATTTIVATANGRYRCTQHKLGNDMLIVIDGRTHKISHTLPAREICIASTAKPQQFVGVSTRHLTSGRQKEYLQISHAEINEGDIVIQMSRGIWKTFVAEGDLIKDPRDPQRVIREYQLNNALANIFESIPIEAPAATIADIIGMHATKRHCQAALLLQELHTHIKLIHQQASTSITLDEWMQACETAGLTDKRAALKSFAKEFLSDGAKPPQNYQGLAANQVVKRLKFMAKGCYASLSVVRAPKQCVELARAFLDDKNNRATLLERIGKFTRKQWLEAISFLHTEVTAVKSEIDIELNHQPKFTPLYTPEQLSVLSDIFDIHRDLQQTKSYSQKQRLLTQTLTCPAGTANKRYFKLKQRNTLFEIFYPILTANDESPTMLGKLTQRFFSSPDCIQTITKGALDQLAKELVALKNKPAEQIVLLRHAKQMALFQRSKSNAISPNRGLTAKANSGKFQH